MVCGGQHQHNIYENDETKEPPMVAVGSSDSGERMACDASAFDGSYTESIYAEADDPKLMPCGVGALSAAAMGVVAK